MFQRPSSDHHHDNHLDSDHHEDHDHDDDNDHFDDETFSRKMTGKESRLVA